MKMMVMMMMMIILNILLKRLGQYSHLSLILVQHSLPHVSVGFIRILCNIHLVILRSRLT